MGQPMGDNINEEPLLSLCPRLPQEKALHYRAFMDYALMGTARSLARVAAMYQSCPDPAPTRHERTLKDWSSKFDWQERVKSWDSYVIAQTAQRERLERRDRYNRLMERRRAFEDQLMDFADEGIKKCRQFDLAIQPVIRSTKHADGTQTVLLPSDPKAHKSNCDAAKTLHDLVKQVTEDQSLVHADKSIAAIALLVDVGLMPSTALDQAAIAHETLADAIKDAMGSPGG